MLKSPDYETARQLLLDAVTPVDTERLPLSECGGRILAQALIAAEHVPPFDRSPYDGYAFRAEDTAHASENTPVTLNIVEEIPAGAVPTREIKTGMAAKVLTGAPIPTGADTVVMFEDTTFTTDAVTLYAPAVAGKNIVRTGEDVQKGAVLAKAGELIDPGLAGMLAAQGVAEPLVYRRPKVAVLSTGSELIEADGVPEPGKIRNTNRYMLETALGKIGCESIYFGIAGDKVSDISEKLRNALAECDAVITTGGVSVGDYDVTPDAMEQIGVNLLFRGVDMKPGMACAYGVWDDKLLCGLSGNPASSLTNFYAVALPALRKLAGWREPQLIEISVTLTSDFKKKSPSTRFLRGHLRLNDGTVRLDVPKEQGNVVLCSTMGCDAMALIPAGSGPIAAGTTLKGFLL